MGEPHMGGRLHPGPPIPRPAGGGLSVSQPFPAAQGRLAGPLHVVSLADNVLSIDQPGIF